MDNFSTQVHKNVVDRPGSNTNEPQIHQGWSLWPKVTEKSDWIYPLGLNKQYSSNHGHKYKFPNQPPDSSTKHYHTWIQYKDNNIDWKSIVILILTKFGLMKLKLFGFLKIVFYFLLKFKLYLIAIFIKFVLLMKLIKSLKALILLPLLTIPLLPSIIQLLLFPGQILDLLRPTATTSSNTPTSMFSGSLQSQFSGLLPSIPGGMSPNQLNGLLSNQLGPVRPGVTTNVNTGDSLLNGIGRFTGRTRLPLFKFQNLNLSKFHDNQTSDLFYLTLNILQNILDSKSCVQSIACQVTTTEKTKVVPLWISW